MVKLKDRRAQSTLEYMLIVAVILAALIAAINSSTFGGSIRGFFTTLGGKLETSVATVPHTTAPPPGDQGGIVVPP